jgi:hypothetical protein
LIVDTYFETLTRQASVYCGDVTGVFRACPALSFAYLIGCGEISAVARAGESCSLTIMWKALLGIAASSFVAVACGTATTTTVGGTPDGGTSAALPAGCSPQPDKLSTQYCEPSETLVACPSGASPTTCKRSVLADSFCCPPPPPTTDPRIQQLCLDLEKCSVTPNLLCQKLLETWRAPCAATFESLLGCALTGDVCTSGDRCADAFASYYTCKGAKNNCVSSVGATAPCAQMESRLGRSIAFSCASEPELTGACASATYKNNTYFLCCEPAFFPYGK